MFKTWNTHPPIKKELVIVDKMVDTLSKKWGKEVIKKRKGLIDPYNEVKNNCCPNKVKPVLR